MPYILIAVGVILADLAWQGPTNITGAGTLLRNEMFGGSDPFYKWLGAIILLGLLGYVQSARGLATALLALVLLAIVLSNRNFSSTVTLIKDL